MYSHGLGICLTGRVRKEGIKIHGPRKTGMAWSGLSDGEAQASHKLSVYYGLLDREAGVTADR